MIKVNCILYVSDTFANDRYTGKKPPEYREIIKLH